MSQKKLTTTVLIILDGWGVPNKKQNTPIREENAPHFFSWKKKFPYTELDASGESVGLFKGQEGNSEAGHLNIGAGRVVKQDARYISDSIGDGTFFKNPAFLQALHHVKKYDTKVHIMGLLSNYNSAHARPEHVYALLDLCHKEGISKVFLHLFTDGRDSGSKDALSHFKELQNHLHGNEKIASVMGRFYAMDRNKNWDRIAIAYDTMVRAEAKYQAVSFEEAVRAAYEREETDEFISPTIITQNGKANTFIEDNDAVFFFNLRSDRARQMTKAFSQVDFESINQNVFIRKHVPKNIRFVAMTDFGPELPGVLVAFPSRTIHNGLVETLCPKKQLYIAETEKYAHVTYFLNGGFPDHFCNEQFVKIESDYAVSYNLKPQMKAHIIADYVIRSIRNHRFEFIAVNFANADMVGHTGDFKAVESTIKILDKELSRMVDALLKEGGQGIITADHGNAEEMFNVKTGEPDTEHSTSKVPFYLVAPHHDYKKLGIPHSGKLSRGKLAQIAPTILKIMNIKKPKEMTAKPLF